jgi:peptidoglycan/LPS O-acetylase OafA/YrhL
MKAAAASLSCTKADSQRFLLLDFMRGIAALAVLVYHDVDYLGFEALPNAYLAVDMFFLLSGFVIAHNYDRKIAAGMSLTDFLAQRMIRLYPCFLLALLLGVGIFALRGHHEYGFLDGWRVLGAAGLNALYLPAFTAPYHLHDLFPFVGAAWSLSFELFANIIYWLTFRLLGRLRLGLLLLVSAGALGAAALHFGTLDVGMRSTDFTWGIARVMVPFFMGVAIRRHLYSRLLSIRLAPAAAAPLALVTLLAAFSGSRVLSQAAVPFADYVFDLMVFPLLLIAVGAVNPGRVTGAICKLTGDASYPVYLLQGPMTGVVAAVPQFLWGVKAGALAPWSGLAHVTVTVLVALLVDRCYELPARRWLKERWQAFRARAAAAPAAA